MARSRSRKKKISKNLAIFIAVVVVLLIIALTVTWFVKPELIDTIVATLFPKEQTQPTNPDNPDNPPDNSNVSDNTTVDGKILEMTVLDIGQGDCIYIAFPDGKNMIMDIGSEFGKPSPWTHANEFLQSRNVTQIDYLFITHGDYDHIREAKKLLDNYEIKNVYMPLDKAQDSSTWLKLIDAAHAETYTDAEGNKVNATYNYNVGAYTISGQNWEMNCYSFDEKDYPKGTDAEKINSVSPVSFLEYADRTIVLTGDANFETEEYLIAKGYFNNVDADVLKVGHHGSATSTSDEFLDKIDAEFAIISTNGTREEKGSYGHPTDEALGRLDTYTDVTPDDDYNGFKQTYITASDGDITVTVGENGGLNITASEAPDKNYGTTEQVNAVVYVSEDYVAVCVKRYEYVVQA